MSDFERVLERFEESWLAGEPPDLRAALSGISDRVLMGELVMIDLERRWRRAKAAVIPALVGGAASVEVLPDRPLIEDYLRQFPALAEGQIPPLKLIVEEYRVRTRWGDQPSRVEYRNRFPEQFAALASEFGAVDQSVILESGRDSEADPGDDDTVSLGRNSPSHDRARPRTATPANRFGDYELLSEIARGGMGVVYKARQLKLNRLVALKMIRSGELADEEQVKRFYSEAEAAAKLDHPGIVPVYEVGEARGQHFFSMALVPGTSLDSRVKGDGPLSPKEAATLLKVVAEAVEYAHGKGVVHRDIKPHNVLLDEAGQPRLTDFGLAKQVKGQNELTVTGQVLGTPSYMPPEQASGELDKIGPASDVYSLGATLYFLLIGRPPFQTASTVETIQQVLNSEPVALRRLNPAIPRDLETISLKCLRKETGKRYATAGELAGDLGNWLENKPIVARPVGPAERTWLWCKRRPTLVGMTLLLLVLAVVGTLVAWERQNATRATGLVENLVSADTPLVPEIVKQLDGYARWADPLLTEQLAQAKEGSTEKLHLSLALVGKDARQVEYLHERLLTAEPNQFGAIRAGLQPHLDQIPGQLWQTLHDVAQPADRRFHAGLALAAYATDSDQWTPADKTLLAEQLVAANPEHQPRLREYLRPIGGQLIDALEALFTKPDLPESQQLGSANALGEFAGSDGTRLARLLSAASPAQHKILYPRLARFQDTSAKEALRKLTSQEPASDLPPDQRLALGKARAGAAITLLRQGAREEIFDVLRVRDDPEALTQFVHGCRAREVQVSELLACLAVADKLRQAKTGQDREIDDRVLFGLLLSLGEFTLGELPESECQPLLDRLAAWYASDASSAVHGATGWLLRHWGQEEVAKNVDHTPVPYSPDRRWFTLDIKTKSGDIRGVGAKQQSAYLTFIVFPAGEYEIGSPEEEPERRPDETRHNVRLTRPFAILDREITWAEFTLFDSRSAGGMLQALKQQTGKSPTPAEPLVLANWYDGVRFCRWLSAQMGLSEEEQAYANPQSLDKQQYPADPNPAANGAPRNWPLVSLDRRGFRLPTEAEWEIAARGGMRSTYGFGDDVSLLDHYGWFVANSGKQTHAPQLQRPNLRGVFDLHGNVWEWCHDWYEPFAATDVENPRGPETGSLRVGRGGSWGNVAANCRTASRRTNAPSDRASSIGFRLALSPSGVPPEAEKDK